VVDAPGWSAEPPVVLPEAAPSVDPRSDETPGARGDVWWLILTAALLAVGIALVLFVKL